MAEIVFRKVCKRYRMGEVEIDAVRDASFEVRDGSFAAVLGPSGAGKTTVLNLIGGMDRASSGRIFIGGRDIARYDDRRLNRYRRDEIGFVFQFYNLMPNLTALENVELARQVGRKPLDPAKTLKRVGLGDRMRNFPSQLSGGEQQRVAIARALCKNPELLLCDEPTGALDGDTGRMVMGLLIEACREYGKTVVVVTHNAAILPIAETVISMRSGRVGEIVENGVPASMEGAAW